MRDDRYLTKGQGAYKLNGYGPTSPFPHGVNDTSTAAALLGTGNALK